MLETSAREAPTVTPATTPDEKGLKYKRWESNYVEYMIDISHIPVV